MSKQTSIGCAIVAALIILPAVFAAGWVASGLAVAHRAASKAQQRQLEAVSKPAPKRQPDPAKQKQRAELLGKLTADGAFDKIEDRGGGLVRVWTGPRFDRLPIDTKKTFVSLVYVYFFAGASGTVVLHDGRTGKEIGKMNSGGLTMR